MKKEYYVIQNEEGKFLKIDDLSGGYPCFIDDFEFCEKYKSRQLAENFLKKHICDAAISKRICRLCCKNSKNDS